MKFLPHRKKEDTMFINAIYHNKKLGGGTDYLEIVYKDLNTGEKFVESIPNPEIDIYFAKEEYRDYNYNKAFMELDKTEMHTTKYNGLPFYIANQAGPQHQNFMEQCKQTGDWGRLNEIHKYQYVFGSDYEIETWVKIQWLLHNDNDRKKPITKQFLDIEADTIDFEGFSKNGECPINAVTIVDEETLEVHTFLLRNNANPLIREFEDTIDKFTESLHDAFDETYGCLNYMIYMYDDELEMLRNIFRLINTLKRDFLLIWNMDYDINYITARIRVLGVEPESVMCDKGFKVKSLFYKKDHLNFLVQNKGDFFKISSSTVYLDQMIVYAGLRKGQGELRSFSLNAVAKEEVKDTKLDYSEEANIKTLPYVNYNKFVMYNIKDVLLQLGIERKTGDVDNVYQRAYSNATPYNKIFKQTVFLKARSYVEFFKQGLIIGNNVNIEYGEYNKARKQAEKDNKDEDDDEKFDGAIVANPKLNWHTGMKIFGKRSMYIYDNVIDMDFSSMYPFIIIAFNIAVNSMIGKLIIDGTISDVMTAADDESEDKIDDKGKEFMDNYLTENYGNMGSKWFSLPGIYDLDKMVRERFGLDGRKPVKKERAHQRLMVEIN